MTRSWRSLTSVLILSPSEVRGCPLDRRLRGDRRRLRVDLAGEVGYEAVADLDDPPVRHHVDVEVAVDHLDAAVALAQVEMGDPVVPRQHLVADDEVGEVAGGQPETLFLGVDVGERQIDRLAFGGAGQEVDRAGGGRGGGKSDGERQGDPGGDGVAIRVEHRGPPCESAGWRRLFNPQW